jgi:DNA-binding NtrC family response regulator
VVILVIDDDEDLRTALSESLRDDGHDVRDYPDMACLPELAELGGFDLVLVDYQLPNRTGISFADEYHAAHPKVPIILITASWSDYLEGQLSRRPFLELLRKPLAYEEVDTLIRQLALR